MAKYPEDFVHRGKTIEFHYATGEVIGTNKFSETHITSSGGGGTVNGYVGPYGGHVGGAVDAPVVTSRSVTNHEFWIRTDDGKEVPIKLLGVDIPLLAGHRITIFEASNKKKGIGYYFCIVNHSAERSFTINNAKELNKKLSLEWSTIAFLTTYAILSLILILSVYYIFRVPPGSPDEWVRVDLSGGAWTWRNLKDWHNDRLLVFPIIISFVVGLYFLISKPIRVSRFKKRFQKYLDALVQFSFESLGGPKPYYGQRRDEGSQGSASAERGSRSDDQSR